MSERARNDDTEGTTEDIVAPRALSNPSPWAVMGATLAENWGREYQWGTAKIDNWDHAELPALRAMLLGSSRNSKKGQDPARRRTCVECMC